MTQGEGFSVVAEEVRSLSMRTDDFNAKIRAKITETEQKLTNSLEMLKSATSVELEGSEESREAVGSMMDEIQSMNDSVAEQSNSHQRYLLPY